MNSGRSQLWQRLPPRKVGCRFHCRPSRSMGFDPNQTGECVTRQRRHPSSTPRATISTQTPACCASSPATAPLLSGFVMFSHAQSSLSIFEENMHTKRLQTVIVLRIRGFGVAGSIRGGVFAATGQGSPARDYGTERIANERRLLICAARGSPGFGWVGMHRGSRDRRFTRAGQVLGSDKVGTSPTNQRDHPLEATQPAGSTTTPLPVDVPPPPT